MRWTAFLVLAFACSAPEGVKVGSKLFTENEVLAEAIALLLEDAGEPVQRLIPFGTTFDCEAGLRSGEIDVYPEYTGTGVAILGLPTAEDADGTYRTAREAWEARELQWGARFGFDNSWAVTTTTSIAAREGLRSMSDLARTDRRWRVGVTAESLDRAIDGVGALERAYGLSPSETVIYESPAERYGALLEGDVELVVGGETDPWIEAFELVELVDDLQFYPPYEPAPVYSERAAAEHPALADAMATLAGKVDLAVIRRAMRAVELEGVPPAVAAARLLSDAGLRELDQSEAPAPAEVLATPTGPPASRIVAQSLAAVRLARGGAQVVPTPADDPLAAAPGHSLALIDAPGLYTIEDGVSRPRPTAHALAAAGWVTAHLIVPIGGPTSWEQLDRVGVGPAHSPAARVAALLDLEIDGPIAVTGEIDRQLEAVRARELPGLLLVAEVGDPLPTRALRTGMTGLASIPWPRRAAVKHPYLRSARIARSAYSQGYPIPTVVTQMVLASTDDDAIDDPALRALQGALTEPLDPMLPARKLAPAPATSASATTPAKSLIIGLTIGLLVFLLARLVKRAR